MLKVLWVKWRDINHPLSGGAEVYMHEIAKRFTSAGHQLLARARGKPVIAVIHHLNRKIFFEELPLRKAILAHVMETVMPCLYSARALNQIEFI